MASVNADVIASASLLLALVAALFGLWYAEINNALGVDVPDGDTARRVSRRKVGPVLWNKAIPLSIAATAIALVFMPRACGIIRASMALIGKNWQYDDLLAAFVLTEIILAILAGVTVVRAVRLLWKWIDLL